MASRSAAAAAAAGPQQVVTSYPFVQQVSPHFTLQQLDQYQGIIKILRLLYIAERCPSLSVNAFRTALRELRSAQPASSFSTSRGRRIALSDVAPLGPNVSLYKEVVGRAQELLLTPSAQPEHQYFLSAGSSANVASDALFAYDQGWAGGVERNSNDIQHGLEQQLSQQKRDGDRDALRIATLNLGEFSLNRGDLNAALNKFQEAKEFVAPSATRDTQLELIHIALNIVKCSVLSNNVAHIKTQVQRAQRMLKEMPPPGPASPSSIQAADKDERDLRVIQCKLNAAMGLFHMKNNAYHSAAQSFVSVTSDMGDEFADVLTLRDVAVYGSICALASFSRRDLQSQLLNNAEWKKLLEVAGAGVWKNMTQQFYNSQYAKVFETVETIKPDLYLDLFLSSHVNRLVRSLRERAFTQYFTAYSSVPLAAMSGAFNLDVASLERTLAELIQDGKIAARIDSHNKILYARHADQRNDTFADAMSLGTRYGRDARAALLRLSLLEADMAVRGASGDAKRSKRSSERNAGVAMAGDDLDMQIATAESLRLARGV